jgi:hypothetical protein
VRSILGINHGMSLALEVTVGHIVLLLSNPMKQTKYDLEIEKMHVLPILLTQVCII